MPLPVVEKPSPPKTTMVKDFVNAPVASLEAQLGAPAFIRREGRNFFQRYDQDACRILAIVTQNSAGQKIVASLTVVPPQNGAPPLALKDCLQKTPQ